MTSDLHTPDAPYVPCRRVGDGSQHHFFGYYNKSNWDRSNRLLAGQRTPWMDHYLTPDAKATMDMKPM